MFADWARAEMAPWLAAAPLGAEDLAARLRAAERASSSVFLYDFAHDYVSLRPKPARGEPAHPEIARRAQLYRDFLQSCLTRFGVRGRFTLAIDVDDHPLAVPGTPVFAFQKHDATASLILLPDVDMISCNFFIEEHYQDDLPFAAKREGAVFAGATTGANLTLALVEARALPRLRSALFFKGSPLVRFTLPKIVQCDGPQTEAAIRALDVGGEEVGWAEQLGYRHILSMDGNGATCSRVGIALHSHAALVKYDSEFRLYYFQGLQPGRHYCAVGDDAEALRLVESARTAPEGTAAVAEAGRAFARRHLSRPSVARYVSALLQLYAEATGAPVPPSPDPLGFLLDVFGHVQNRGDVWADGWGWLGDPDGRDRLESFGLDASPELDADEVRCQALLDDGRLGPVTPGRAACGTRRQSRPLRGFRIWLEGEAGRTFQVGYEAAFSDGRRLGPIWNGALCQGAPGAELTALRLSLRRRPDA